MAKKIIKITESKLIGIINNIILENEREAWGSKEITNLEKGLSPDEDINLSDTTGDLRGKVVSKKEYLRSMLIDALERKDWGKVKWAIMYIDQKMKQMSFLTDEKKKILDKFVLFVKKQLELETNHLKHQEAIEGWMQRMTCVMVKVANKLNIDTDELFK